MVRKRIASEPLLWYDFINHLGEPFRKGDGRMLGSLTSVFLFGLLCILVGIAVAMMWKRL